MKKMNLPSFSKILSTALAASITLLSMGQAAPAIAQTMHGAPVMAGPAAPIVPVVPSMGGSLSLQSPALTNSLSPNLSAAPSLTLPTVSPTLKTAPAAASVSQVSPSAVSKSPLAAASASQVSPSAVSPAVAQAVKSAPAAAAVSPAAQARTLPGESSSAPLGKSPLTAASVSPAAGATSAAGAAPVTAKQTLAAGADSISKAEGTSGRFSALRSLFTGSRKTAVEEASAVAGTEVSGRNAPALSGLSALTLSDLEAVAIDSSKPLAERQDAVKQIAKQGTPEAKASLEKVAAANPEGLSPDYEIHRAALRAIALTFKDLRSLRPISAAHKAAILSELEKNKPEMYITDYDDTLEPLRAKLTPEMAEALKAAADAGVETAILTDRGDTKRDDKDFTVMDSLADLTPAQKARLTVFSNRGTRGLLFNSKGEPVLVLEQKIEFTAAEKSAIQATAAEAAAIYGQGEFNGKKEFWEAYSYSMLLPVGTPEATVKAAAAFFTEALAKKGVNIDVVPRTVKNPKDAPYLTVSRIDKTVGVKPLRGNRRVFETMRDLISWGLPARYAQKAFAWANRLMPARPVPAKKTVVVGDQFFDTKVSDIGLAKGTPGGLAISVGAKADPRLDDVVVWPSEGHAASLEVLTAIGKQAPSEMDKKAVAGLFAQRTVSIAAYILVSIAYPFLAVPAVGWSGYGILMSFGPLAGIATGPLSGLIADKLSARNAMALNTVVRVAMSLFLPVMAAFGVLNFTTLLIASFANGWLLSSIMVTEGAYTKRLAGAKNVYAVNNLAWMNYLGIQVILGLLLGVGSVVDKWNPMLAFTINAAVNALIVLPIIWFTMPKLSPSPKTLVSMEARIGALEASLASAKDKAAVEKELADLKKALPAREAELKTSIEKNKQVIAENAAALAELAAQTPTGLRAKLERRSEMASLKADNGIRAKAVDAAEKELARFVPTLKTRLAGAVNFFKNNLLSAALFGAGIGLYFLTNTTLPMIGALAFWITTTDGFKVLWHGKGSEVSPREKALADKMEADKKAGLPVDKAAKAELKTWKSRLPQAMLLLALIALMMYPLQYLAIPKIATLIVGQEAKALVTGQLLGSLFFGNLIANSAKAKLPEVRLPLVGKVPAERLIQLAVTGLGVAWVATGLFPGSILAAAAAALIIPGLIYAASKLSNRAFVKFVGVGFSAIWLPYLAWGTKLLPFMPVQMALILSLLAIGMTFGPAYSYLQGYFYGNAAKDKSGTMGGVSGSLFNAAVSGGYGVLALAASLINPAYPTLLAAMGVFFILAGLAFWRAPKTLPGIPDTLLEKK